MNSARRLVLSSLKRGKPNITTLSKVTVSSRIHRQQKVLQEKLLPILQSTYREKATLTSHHYDDYLSHHGDGHEAPSPSISAALDTDSSRQNSTQSQPNGNRLNQQHQQTRVASPSLQRQNSYNNPQRSRKTPLQVRNDAELFLERIVEQKKKNPEAKDQDQHNITNDKSVGLEAKRLLIDMANYKPSYTSGPLASWILDAVIQYPSVYDDKALAAKLHCLTMEIWIKSGHRNAMFEAESIFWKLIANKDDFLIKDNLQSNVYSFNDAFCLIINALTAKTRHNKLSPAVARRVHVIIDTIQQLWSNKDVPLAPNTPACNAILFTLMKQRQHEQAVELLQTMLNDWKTHGDQRSIMKPNRTSFTTTITACSKAGVPDKALEVLQTMMALHQQEPALKIPFPTFNNFTDVLNGFARCREDDAIRPVAGKRAEEVLEWIQQLYDSGKHQVLDAGRSMTYNINSVMYAWVVSGSPEAAQRVHSILRNILKQYYNVGDKNEEAGSSGSSNIGSSNSDPLTSHPNIAIVPDDTSFWTVVHAWHSECQRRLEHKSAIEQHKEEQAVENIKHVLEWMQQFYLQNSKSDLKKTKYVYAEAIRVILLQQHKEKEKVVGDAVAVAEQMKTLGLDCSNAEKLIEKYRRSNKYQ